MSSDQYRISVIFEGQDKLTAEVRNVNAALAETNSLTEKTANVVAMMQSRVAGATEAYKALRSELREASFMANAVERAFKLQHDTLADVIGVAQSVSSAIGKLQHMFTQYQVTQIRLIELSERVAEAERKHAEAVVKYGANSEQARKAAEELARAKKELEKATFEAQLQMVGFALQLPSLAKNAFDAAAKITDLMHSLKSTTAAVEAADGAVRGLTGSLGALSAAGAGLASFFARIGAAVAGFASSVGALLAPLAVVPATYYALGKAGVVTEDLAQKAADATEAFAALYPFMWETAKAASSMTPAILENAENLGWFAGETFEATQAVDQVSKKISVFSSILKSLAASFKLSGDQVAAIVNRVLGLSVVYDQHAELVAKLEKEMGISEAQARALVNALEQEALAQAKAAESAKAAEQARRQMEEATRRANEELQKGINALLTYGQVEGPLSGALSRISKAFDLLGVSIGQLPWHIRQAISYFDDLNNKIAETEQNMRTLKAASEIVSFGINYLNTMQKISHALIIDEIQAIDEQIRAYRERLAQLEEQAKTLPAWRNAMKQEIETLREQIAELERQKQTLMASIQLTNEQAATQERLQAIQSALSLVTQQLTLVQTGLQLAMMGATQSGQSFLNAVLALIDAQADGIVTEQEMKNVLSALGIQFDETGKPVMNLTSFFAKFKEEVLANIEKVSEFRSTLASLDGMTVHTYHYHHIIEVRGTEEEAGGGGRPRPYQRGSWFVPFTGLALLHRGEMVIPRDIAEEIRSGRGGRSITVNVTVNVDGITDPEQLAEIVSREIARKLRVLAV
jgi:septal ring factor EnvC (AmiA/AmiB activator)